MYKSVSIYQDEQYSGLVCFHSMEKHEDGIKLRDSDGKTVAVLYKSPGRTFSLTCDKNTAVKDPVNLMKDILSIKEIHSVYNSATHRLYNQDDLEVGWMVLTQHDDQNILFFAFISDEPSRVKGWSETEVLKYVKEYFYDQEGLDVKLYKFRGATPAA